MSQLTERILFTKLFILLIYVADHYWQNSISLSCQLEINHSKNESLAREMCLMRRETSIGLWYFTMNLHSFTWHFALTPFRLFFCIDIIFPFVHFFCRLHQSTAWKSQVFVSSRQSSVNLATWDENHFNWSVKICSLMCVVSRDYSERILRRLEIGPRLEANQASNAIFHLFAR